MKIQNIPLHTIREETYDLIFYLKAQYMGHTHYLYMYDKNSHETSQIANS